MSLRILLCLLALGASTLFGQSQAGLASISGVVQDASGAVIPGASVTVVNESKGIRRTLQTNAGGYFSAPSLVPAAGYVVTVNAQGFATAERKQIELLVGQQVNLPITLAVASAAQEVQVTSEAPIVETTKTGVSQVVNEAQIQNLPINGRRVDSFVLLTPAVVSDGTFGLISFRGIAGGNAFLTDGNDTTNQFYNENAGRTRITTQISQDAVQEFQVLSNGYSAEFGRASGGVINTVTRSGTNDLHGTGYWFFRNRSLNARDPYSTFNPPEVRHQFGGSLAGALVKDKLFYFFNGEATRRRFPLISSLTRPPLFTANGDFVETQANGQPTCRTTGAGAATPAQCAAARSFLNRQFQVLPRTADTELGFGKIDWRPVESHSFSFSFNYMRWISPNGIQTQAVLNNGNGVGNNADSTVRTRYGRAAWTAIASGTLVNEFRFGWFKDRLFDDINPALVPPQTGRVQISVQGQSNLGVADAYPRLNPSEQRFQFADTLSWVAGKHSLKFGVDFTNTRDYNDILRVRNGSYNYATFTDFALDFSGNTTGAKRWNSYTQRFGNPIVDTTIRDYAFFVQDQHRVTTKLTLNYGLRYEFAQFTQPKLTNPDYPQTGRIPNFKGAFGPRFGVAYAMSEKTVLRAGYGLFHARYGGGLINTLHLDNGVYQRVISLNIAVPTDAAAGPVFPNRLPSLDRTPPVGTVDLAFAAPDFRPPYTQQADIGIERELTSSIGLTVSYLWSRGLHHTTGRDLNAGALGDPVTYRINNAQGQQVGTYTTPTYRLANRIDRRWRRVIQVEGAGNSYYNALVTQLRKRMSHGLEASVAYTWSHAIDYNQGRGNDNTFYSTSDLPRSLFNGDYRGDKSSSSLDQRHRFVFTSLYSPTFTASRTPVARYLVNGWQLSQITILASAMAQTPTVRIVGVPFAGAAFNSTLNGFAGSSRAPFLPTQSLDIDQVYRVDARLTKALPFTERVQLYLNFEAFNVFNNPYNTSVNGEAFSAANGVLTPTPRLGEGSAAQGFPDGTNARRAQVSLRLVF